MNFTVGPFAKARIDVDRFCNNLYIAHAIDSYTRKIMQAQDDYEKALLCDDKELQEQKLLEINSYKASLQLTAIILEDQEGFII